MSKKKKESGDSFVSRYVMQRQKKRNEVGLSPIIEAWQESEGSMLTDGSRSDDEFSNLSESSSGGDLPRFSPGKRNLEDEVKAFEFNDSSSGKSSRPPSRLGIRNERRGSESSGSRSSRSLGAGQGL